MNPLEIRRVLAPVVGDEVARALAEVARVHKNGTAFRLTCESSHLVILAEKLAELAPAMENAATVTRLERRIAYLESEIAFRDGTDVYSGASEDWLDGGSESVVEYHEGEQKP